MGMPRSMTSISILDSILFLKETTLDGGSISIMRHIGSSSIMLSLTLMTGLNIRKSSASLLSSRSRLVFRLPRSNPQKQHTLLWKGG